MSGHLPAIFDTAPVDVRKSVAKLDAASPGWASMWAAAMERIAHRLAHGDRAGAERAMDELDAELDARLADLIARHGIGGGR